MRHRLAVAMVLVVAGALLVAGLGSLLAARLFELHQASVQIGNEARTLATAIDARESALPQVTLRQDARFISAVGSTFISDVSFLVVTPQGTGRSIFVRTSPGFAAPALTAGDLQALGRGSSVYGIRGGDVFAAAPLELTPGQLGRLGVRAGFGLAIYLADAVHQPGGSGVYFLIAGGASLVVAVFVAQLLARRLARPIASAAVTTQRIAAGDLDARVPADPAGHDPPELVQLGEAINSMAAALSRSRGLERQFLLSISHDLRTPLTSIRGYAEAIADGAAENPQQAAAVIESEARRLERLIQDLLDLTRIEARRFAIDNREVDVGQVVSTAADGLRLGLQESGLVLLVEIAEPGPMRASADPDRLAQVVANLVDNASKFARRTVRLAVRRQDDDRSRVTIVVEDDGPGIAPADLPHVFDRFFRSVTGPAKDTKGIGLGLAIVAELTMAMGGEVRAFSPIDGKGGTRMVVRLAPPPPPPPPRPPAQAVHG